MYWLRWHYHVKDIAGAPYKIKKEQKNKTTESPTVSSRGLKFQSRVEKYHDIFENIKSIKNIMIIYMYMCYFWTNKDDEEENILESTQDTTAGANPTMPV